MAKYLITHDLGTGGDKCNIYNENCELLGSVFEEYETIVPKDNYAEQKPENWWEAIKNTTKKVINKTNVNKQNICGLGIDAQMCGCVPVDKNCKLLKETTMIWNDSRSVKQIQEIFTKIDLKDWYKLTGGGLRPENYSASKIMWMRKYENDVYEKTYKFLGAKDYIIMKLTGAFVTDYSEASSTSLLDLKNRKWSDKLLNITGIPREKLPELHESTDVVGYISKNAAKELGVKKGLPVVTGMGDIPATALGAGAVSEDYVYGYMGTCSLIGVSTHEPLLSPESRPYIFCHGVPGMYVNNMAIYCGGQAYRWVRDVICKKEKEIAEKENKDVYEIMNEKAKLANVGADKLLFIPHLMGGGTIQKTPNTRGAFIGLNINHKRKDLIRSVKEGVAFALKQVMDEFEKLSNKKLKALCFVGGGGKSKLWRQIFADIMNKNIIRLSIGQDTGCLGTAIVTGIGVGLYKDFDVVNNILEKDDISTPNKEVIAYYEELYSIFCDTSDTLAKAFDKLAEI